MKPMLSAIVLSLIVTMSTQIGDTVIHNLLLFGIYLQVAKLVDHITKKEDEGTGIL